MKAESVIKMIEEIKKFADSEKKENLLIYLEGVISGLNWENEREEREENEFIERL